MAAFNPELAALAVLTALGVCANAAAAPPARGRETIALDAQSSELDLKSNNVMFRKVRIAQGGMAVTADQGQASGQASGLNFDDSVWVFRGNVHITMDQGELLADNAEIDFRKKLLSVARAHGRPAQFEQRIAKTGKVAKGRADTIDYDAARGVIRLIDNAWLSDGQNEIRGESLKYNVVAQSIVADAAEQGSKRIHIIITPPPQKQP
jgi:lipopolysaccharide transport protein LptA